MDRKFDTQHLAPVSLSFPWKKVGAFLKLPPECLSDIEVEERTEQERRVATLRSWMETFGNEATYGVLMRALLRCHLKEQALNVGVLLLRREKRLNSDSK